MRLQGNNEPNALRLVQGTERSSKRRVNTSTTHVAAGHVLRSATEIDSTKAVECGIGVCRPRGTISEQMQRATLVAPLRYQVLL